MKQYIKILEESQENKRAYLNTFSNMITLCLNGKKQIKFSIKNCHYKIINFLYKKSNIYSKAAYTTEEIIENLYPLDLKVNDSTIRFYISEINRFYKIIKRKKADRKNGIKSKYYLEV